MSQSSLRKTYDQWIIVGRPGGAGHSPAVYNLCHVKAGIVLTTGQPAMYTFSTLIEALNQMIALHAKMNERTLNTLLGNISISDEMRALLIEN